MQTHWEVLGYLACADSLHAVEWLASGHGSRLSHHHLFAAWHLGDWCPDWGALPHFALWLAPCPPPPPPRLPLPLSCPVIKND